MAARGLVRLTGALLAGLAGAAWAGDGFRALAPGVFVLEAAQLSAAAPPPGEAANVGLVAGRDGALVIGTGASHRQGGRVLAAARAAAGVPPSAALISQALPEYLFGASAFQDAHIPVLAHVDTAALIAQRCDICLQRLRAAHGEAAMAGSKVPVPDRRLKGDQTLDLGGRQVRLLDFGWAATPGDMAVLDAQTGTLFAGGLVVVDTVPNVRDAQVDAWRASLARIRAMGLARIVPGRGPVVDAAALAALEHYLEALEARVRTLYDAQASLSEAVERAALPEFSAWAGYPEVHRQNVQIRYLALEKAELQQLR